MPPFVDADGDLYVKDETDTILYVSVVENGYYLQTEGADAAAGTSLGADADGNEGAYAKAPKASVLFIDLLTKLF